MTVSFYLARLTVKGKDKDGNPALIPNPNPTVIYARICFEGQKFKYHLPESILPALWNTSTHRAKETKKFQEYPEFNRRLDNIESGIKTIIRKYVNDHAGKYPTERILKQLLDTAIRDGGNVDKMTFHRFFKDFIARCENGTRIQPKSGQPITKGTIRTYNGTLTCIEAYQKHARHTLDFESIDMTFYNDFLKYLTLTSKVSTNYIGKHIKVIKTVLADATALGYNSNMAYKGRGFTTLTEDVDTVYLAEWELDQVAAIDFTDNKGREAVRDLFLVGCYTGLRFSDLSTLRPGQISGDLITITQLKTSKPVVIPVHDTVKQIMTKYGGQLPAAISNQKTNDHLKEICKHKEAKALKSLVSVSGTKAGERQTRTVEKWNLVSTHTARRSFATNEYLAGTPTLTIMAITGHKTEKAFLKYIRVTPDQHAKILQGIWADRKETKAKRIAL